MRVLVLGGMHGNEPLGLRVVNLFQDKPVKGIDAIFANESAIKANKRFVKSDLNRSFPGKSTSNVYELMRAAQLLRLTKKFDLVLDFHNTYCPENDCGFVGQTADEKLYGVSLLLGLKRIIVADYDCINKYADNCLSVEISLDSEQNDANIWYERISALSRQDEFNTDVSGLEKYRFVYRMTLEDKKRFDLTNKNLRAFQPMEEKLAKAMGVKSPAYPIFIGDKFTPYNYGGLLNKI